MNILFYCDEYPPAKQGGIGTVVKLVAESLCAGGHHVMVAGDYSNIESSIGKLEAFEVQSGVTVYRLLKSEQKRDTKLKIFKLLNFVFLNKLSYLQFLIAKRKIRIKENYIRGIIAKEEVDILELVDYQDEVFHNLTRPIVFKKYNVPTIMRVHGSCSFLQYYKKGKIDNVVLQNDREHFNRADAICAVSRFAADFVTTHLTNRQVSVVYNPIKKEMFDNTTIAQGNTILFFGKIVETKGAYNVIKAFNKIAPIYSDIQLKLVGSGDIEYAKTLIHKDLIDRVVFLGFCEHNKVIQEIDNSLFCVLPSFFENFSMAALEVLARKRALIYTERASGNELIEDGVNGFLVNPENIEQVVDRMKLLLDNRELLNVISEKGYINCENRFCADVIVPQLEKIYSEMVK